MIKAAQALLLLPLFIGTCAPLLSGSASPGGRLLFLTYNGQIPAALEAYEEYRQAQGRHDFTLLQRIALTLIEREWRSTEPARQLMALFGAGIAMDDSARQLLEEGLAAQLPQLQLIALHLLAQNGDDDAELAILRALNSEYMLVRCEAAVYLAQRHHPRATAQIDALFHRVPTELHQLFPQLYAASGDRAAITALRRLLTHPLGNVRTEAIVALADGGRDDLLPAIRQLACQHEIAQQEACCYALSRLNDTSSLTRLSSLTASQEPSVSLAALLGCYRLGEVKAWNDIARKAEKGDLFAIASLAEIPEGKETLANLLKSVDKQMRINAAIALLLHGDSRCHKVLKEILIGEEGHLTYNQWTTPGRTLKAWKIAPYFVGNSKDAPISQEISLGLREKLLIQAALLSEEIFLPLAQELLSCQQNDLIPTLAALLEQNHSPAAIALLQKHQQQLGAPLVRTWCALALYRATSDKSAAETLRSWVKSHCKEEMISFRTLVPIVMREKERTASSPYQLTPQEQCRLLIEILEAFAQARDEDGVDVLLHALIHGNEQNRPVLAGLLFRATQ